jgi:hypothetical protein
MKPRILIQLDTDPQPSVFDGVVAVDAGVEFLFRHGGIAPENVRELVHGALFTRGPADLARTAIFVGGSDVEAAERVLKAVNETFFGPFRVSVMLDANGCNTTAAAAVLAAIDGAGGSVENTRVAVLGGTGPVGQRVAQLLAREGARVFLGSRRLDRARDVAERIRATLKAAITPFASASLAELVETLREVSVIVCAGAAGAELLPKAVRLALSSLKVAIDLNAVPPVGIEGVKGTDRGEEREGVRVWGALGVGATKMKIHKRAVQSLFEANDRVLDAEACLALGRALS